MKDHHFNKHPRTKFIISLDPTPDPIYPQSYVNISQIITIEKVDITDLIEPRKYRINFIANDRTITWTYIAMDARDIAFKGIIDGSYIYPETKQICDCHE